MTLPQSGDKGAAFPVVYWPQWKCRASFFAADALPDFPKDSLYAVLGFVFHQDQVVLAHIRGRGYCIPSGKIEPGEEPLDALIRETYEETGARLEPHRAHVIGWYGLEPNAAATPWPQRICPVYMAEVDSYSDIPDGSESDGVRLATLEEVPVIYFFWDELIAAVFKHSELVRRDLLK